MVSPDEMDELAFEYCTRRSLIVESQLGVGTQGSVYSVTNENGYLRHAIKIHEREDAYLRERNCYIRLHENEITHIQGHRVPLLIHFDDTMLAIEMTTVSPPFCLDFGGAYLDRRPDYSPEVWADWHEQKSEAFEDNWPAALAIIRSLETLGIYVADVNPGNIKFS